MFAFINYYSVFIYGFLIMLFLLNIKSTKKNLTIIIIYSIFWWIILFHLYDFFGMDFIIKSYPLIVHLPLVLFFYFHFKKSIPAVLFVLCTAYVLTTPRKWLGEFFSLLFKGNQDTTLILQILISIPILLIVYKFLRPVVIKLIKYSETTLLLLSTIPFIYYVVAYSTTVYTDFLYRSNVLVVGILTTILTYILFTFLVVYFNQIEKKFALENDQILLKHQASISETQMQQFRESQKEMVIHRHDLRHHLNLIDGYISKGNNEEARSYISKINNSIDKFFIRKYCENETINSILSYYISKAEVLNIILDLNVVVPTEIPIDSMDICVILSNGLENAINAVGKITEIKNRRIKISAYLKNNKFCIEIINIFAGEILFENELPYTLDENHGIGTKSIILACSKYKGLYSFEAEDNVFTLRVIL